MLKREASTLLYIWKTTFTCLLFSAFNSGLKFCGNSWSHRGFFTGLSPLPVRYPCNFTACCQGLWDCSWKKLIPLWERLKADLSPGSWDSHYAPSLPGRTTTELYSHEYLGFAPTLPPLSPRCYAQPHQATEESQCRCLTPPRRAAASAAGRTLWVSREGTVRFALIHLFLSSQSLPCDTW